MVGRWRFFLLGWLFVGFTECMAQLFKKKEFFFEMKWKEPKVRKGECIGWKILQLILGRIEATIPDDLWMGDVFFFSILFFWEVKNTSAGKCFTRLKGKLAKNILKSLLNFHEKVQTTGIACLISCFQRFANVAIQNADLPTTTSNQWPWRLQCGSLAELHSRCARLRFPPCGGAQVFFGGLGGHLEKQSTLLNLSCQPAIITFLDLVCWLPLFLIWTNRCKKSPAKKTSECCIKPPNLPCETRASKKNVQAVGWTKAKWSNPSVI